MNFHKLKQYIQNNLFFGENGCRSPKVTLELLASAIMPNTSRVWGIDISHWNLPPVNLKRMKDMYGMSFVIIKANDGSLKTKYVAEHVQATKDAGLPFGLYAWLYPNGKVSIDAQVSAWVASHNLYKPSLGIFIDAETTYYGGTVANPQASDLTAAHEKLKASIGLQTTYTSQGYAKANLVGFDWNKYPRLWVANYTTASAPLLPPGASVYEFWQYTDNLDGVQLDPSGNKSLDGNYYNGTAEQFAAKYGGTTPPNGGTMLYQTKVTLWFRSQPAATEATKIVAMPVGSKVWGEVGADGWVKATHLQLAGEQYAKVQAGYCFYSLDYLTALQYVAPVLAPPPVVDDEIEIIVNGETKYHIIGKLQ